ncbi:MAG: hypothetical protein Q7W38_08490 [Deltaproteobacteria bacterium]|nr:hypothetical protein [Deltaproteobacteria bacterium]
MSVFYQVKVYSPGIFVYFHREFMVAGKGVHDVGILSQGLQNVRVHPKDFLRPLIVIDLVAELLPGDLGDIQNIRFRGDLPPIYRAVQGLAARDLVFPK